MPKIVFWQNIPSMHQAALIRSTASSSGAETVLVAEDDVPMWRSDSGWHAPDFGSATVHVRPDSLTRRRLMDESDQRSVHIFSGIDAYASAHEALGVVTATGREQRPLAVVMMESWDHRGPRGRLRAVKYAALAKRWRSRLDGLLAIGMHASPQYVGAGFPEARVFPFGYFLPSELDDPVPDAEANGYDKVRLSFVGRVTSGKGVDLLLEATASIDAFPWHIDMVGDGPYLAQGQAIARRLGIGNRVTWHGSLPNAQARALLAQSDLLVLPSHYDGWGAVVNEALLCGTKVVVSDAVGAATVVRGSTQGGVFKTGDARALANSIRQAASTTTQAAEDRRRLRVWAHDAIGPEAGGTYLLAILRHLQGVGERPEAPWLRPPASTPPT